VEKKVEIDLLNVRVEVGDKLLKAMEKTEVDLFIAKEEFTQEMAKVKQELQSVRYVLVAPKPTVHHNKHLDSISNVAN